MLFQIRDPLTGLLCKPKYMGSAQVTPGKLDGERYIVNYVPKHPGEIPFRSMIMCLPNDHFFALVCPD